MKAPSLPELSAIVSWPASDLTRDPLLTVAGWLKTGKYSLPWAECTRIAGLVWPFALERARAEVRAEVEGLRAEVAALKRRAA